MPELPDIEVFSANLNKIFAGKKVTKVNVINGNKLKDKPTDSIPATSSNSGNSF